MYKETLSKILLFATGAAIGSVVTYKLVKDKFEKRADEEIESMREHYKKKEKALNESSEEEVYEPTEEELAGYSDIIDKAGYGRYSNNKVTEKNNSDKADKPYQIAIDEYGLFDDYTECYLTYYSDGYLVDDDDNVVDNMDDVIGEKNIEALRDHVCDVIYIRNDSTKTDYEISYSSVIYKEYLDE